MTPELIENSVATYFRALRDMDVDGAVNAFAPDAVNHDPVGGPPQEGHPGIRAFLSGVMGLFDNVGLQEQEVFVAGNEAAVKWIGFGRGKNGRDVRFEGIDVFSVNEQGKIQNLRAYWDPAPVIAAITAPPE